MLEKLLPLFMLCGTLCAAEIPGGWKPYHSAPAGAEKGVVEYTGNHIRVSDPGDKTECGITQTFNCPPGSCFRFSVEVKLNGQKPLDQLEVSAYYYPAQKERAGSLRITRPGSDQSRNGEYENIGG